jgi:hypothetical protein
MGDSYMHGNRIQNRWPFTHPPTGTCVGRCESYGRCHCGCGERPRESSVTFEPDHRVQGEPHVFRSGHHSRVFPRRAGHWSKNGVPVERVRPLLSWLHKRHGTWHAVAALLRMPVGTIRGYANNAERRRVPPEAAHQILRLVLAHRKRGGNWINGKPSPECDEILSGFRRQTLDDVLLSLIEARHLRLRFTCRCPPDSTG